MKKALTICLLIICFSFNAEGQKRKSKQVVPQESINETIFSGLKMRSLSPGITGGRITDVAIHPLNKNIRYVSCASAGVWKTSNLGTTWTPVFDSEGSYSIGTVVIDKSNPNVVWVGTGENNAQRSVSRGDGVYKSSDGGKSWMNMGLKTSEHIGKIIIHPSNSNIIYVASQGSVWKAGGERGLYKTIDGGNTWERILHVSDDTGISDVIVDPHNPDVIIASAYQRRRHFGMLVAGGPEGGAHKSVDGGKTWKKMANGFPSGELGRIGLARSPQQSDVLYAIVAGTDRTSGIYRSSDNGSSWKMMNNYKIVDAQYYMEIFPDPHQFDRIYIIDMLTKVSEDGGKTLSIINHDFLHVDNHDVDFDLTDPNYLLIAGDGGIYESWDRGENWRFTKNLPIAQFYRVGIDNAKPFYNVYGGTQDNNTVGGPSQTIHRLGIKNSDWFITQGGDGFQTRIDPTNPDVVYSMSQYAGIVRYDRKSGERIGIKPLPKAGEPPYRWNWDAPLTLSNYNSSTLYFGANKLFKSEDKGNSWTEISPDLTRQLDRNKMEIMGKVWGIDAVFKNVWTSPYGTIVALDESPLRKGLLYVGTDDGLIQVTENDGGTWRKVEGIAGVPKLAYLSDLHASPHNENTVFAVFNNHKYGDYKPYVYRSDDKGATWKSISANIPNGDFAWTILQDHKAENLLFIGTEYGMYFSLNDGDQWIKFKSGIPTIAIRDIEIQKTEDDLVAASFGRGFYILDDYSLLRQISSSTIDKKAEFFEVKDALSYIVDNPDGYAIGADFFSSPNPEFGASFNYYLKEGAQTQVDKRRTEESALSKAGQPIPYPDWTNFTKEQWEDKPVVIFTIMDNDDKVVARVNAPDKKGINKVNWNLRHTGTRGNNGPLVSPAKYTVTMSRLANGKWMDLELSQSFMVKSLDNNTFPTEDPAALETFQLRALVLSRQINNSNRKVDFLIDELSRVKKELSGLTASPDHLLTAESLRQQLLTLEVALNGNDFIVDKMELIPPSIAFRVRRVVGQSRSSRSDPTSTQIESFEIASKEYTQWEIRLNKTIDNITNFGGSIKSTGVVLLINGGSN